MGRVTVPEPVTPIASVFTGDEGLFAAVRAALAERLGPCIYASPVLPFDHTDYYAAEMGPDLKRRLFAFADLVDPGELPALKHWSNSLEAHWAVDGRRRVNIDVGYITLAKLVLATTKDHAHRLYLGKGIYGEVTLRYVGGRFEPWPWTYPDYASPAYRKICAEIRELHRARLRTR
ncbi:DUF4416 family protein [Gelria sp. Kuro-4]|uniref:DUF4416 family protein n=1 Tax=Gelria sp. Kuro-4 TaxID=2796927 RepID=UPI001BF16A7C|nr:DUF4416 family protein [Gelria sp. Kuro-4]BCV25565.1 hypothetical protein kuro4_23380 [Gelria sp. Kuro-4]